MKTNYFDMTDEEKMMFYGLKRDEIPDMDKKVREMLTPDPDWKPYQWKFAKYLNQNVKIVLKDGGIVHCYVDNLADPDDNDFEEEGIEFYRGGCIVEVLEHEIESIEIIDDERAKMMAIPPKELQSFSKSLIHPNYNAFVHFYEEDYKTSKFRKCPEDYLTHLRKFAGVISPDFSIGWCDPIEVQKEHAEFNTNCYNLFVNSGLNCIRNVRYGDANSYDFCFEWVPRKSMLAIGSHGALRRADYRLVFEAGLDELCKRRKPHTLIVYGYAPDDIFKKYKDAGIRIIRFPSEFEQTHKADG